MVTLLLVGHYRGRSKGRRKTDRTAAHPLTAATSAALDALQVQQHVFAAPMGEGMADGRLPGAISAFSLFTFQFSPSCSSHHLSAIGHLCPISDLSIDKQRIIC